MAASWEDQSSSGLLEGIGAGAMEPPRWANTASLLRKNSGRPSGARLSRAVEAEIVPRLVLGHREAPQRSNKGGAWAADPGSVRELAGCAVADADAASDYVAAIRACGAGVEAVYLDLLAPAARRLGEQWEDDSLSFVDVTIGLLRLHQVMRALAPEFRAEAAPQRPGRRALLVPAPGEQHSFGLAMVTEFFRRAGWSVWSGTPTSLTETLALARGEWFGVIGFSVGCDDRLEALASCIRRVRAVSRNPAIGVMVGGPIFVVHPELATAVGADTTARDGRHATFQAEGLLALQPVRR